MWERADSNLDIGKEIEEGSTTRSIPTGCNSTGLNGNVDDPWAIVELTDDSEKWSGKLV